MSLGRLLHWTFKMHRVRFAPSPTGYSTLDHFVTKGPAYFAGDYEIQPEQE